MGEQWADWKYRILFATLVLLVVVNPFVTGATLAKWLLDVLLLLVLIAAVPAVAQTRRRMVIAMLVGLPGAVAICSQYITDDTATLRMLTDLLIGGFLVYVACSLLVVVLKAKEITTDMIFAALCVYLLLGVIWSLLYLALFLSGTGTPEVAHFRIPDEFMADDEGNLLSIFTYYSFVTLTTLGYGDMTPISPAARTVAWLEALIGQLFVAVLIARLVGLHIAARARE